jgi:hypothetical protein
MTWTIARPAVSAAAACLLALALGGCASGPMGPAPVVTDPLNAGNVTFYRDGSWVGLWTNIRVRLDGRDLVRLGVGEHYSFSLDPGEYLVEFAMGFNQCRRAILVRPKTSYRYRMVPNCYFVDESY